MALSTAVVITVADTHQKHELFEYPADVDELDDVILEHLVTNGQPHKVMVGNSQIKQQDLDDAVERAAVLHVCVVMDAPKTSGPAKVVFKLVDARPVRKYELSDFPQDFDEVDDIVLNNLVTEGDDFIMRAEGALLTSDSYFAYRSLGQKLVIHVSRPGRAKPAPAPPNTDLPRATGGSPEAQRKMQEVIAFRETLKNAQQAAYIDGKNVLMVSMEAESELFKKIKADAETVGAHDHELRIEAKDLMKEMVNVFDAGLTETLNTRKTITNIQRIVAHLGEAFMKGDTTAAHLYMQQCETLAHKLEDKSKLVKEKIADLQSSLTAKYNQYSKAEAKYRRVQKWSTGGAVGSGVGAAGCGVGALTSGVVIAEVPAVAGWFSTTAAIPAMWNPAGVAFLVGMGVCTVVALVAAGNAQSYGAAKEAMGEMGQIANKAEKMGAINESLWNGVSKHMSIAKEAMNELALFTPEQLELYGNALVDAAASLSTVEKAVDEYLVYLSIKKLYPINFNVEAVVGHKRYKELQDEMSVRVV